ncbi:MAG: hypothetical protein GDA67_14760 [Nitrospira sp. CR1.3]|nr:hypothetical protein [Nitrospira sp. CR1.3]
MGIRFLRARRPRPGQALVRFGLACTLSFASIGLAEAQEPAQPPVSSAEAPAAASLEPARVDPSITLRGSVWRTKTGIVFLKTPVGMLTFSSKTTLKDLRASHEVLFWVHEQNSVVDIRKKSDGSLVHRYLTGPMTFGADVPKTLRWWTPEGEETTHFGTQEERLGAFHEGDLLTVEVDEAHTVVGVHDLQYDLQISQTPPSGSQAQLLLSGTVSKLKSNFVFFRTPVGLVMVNSKIGVPQVKVGQPMTLRIDNQQVTVDLAPVAAKSSRNSQVPTPSLAPAP